VGDHPYLEIQEEDLLGDENTITLEQDRAAQPGYRRRNAAAKAVVGNLTTIIGTGRRQVTRMRRAEIAPAIADELEGAIGTLDRLCQALIEHYEVQPTKIRRKRA
jgi:hypothetical protein